MLAVAVFGVLAGAILAQRFTIFILVPSTFITVLAAAAAGMAAGDGAWVTLLGSALAAVALQLGYFAGAAMQLAIRPVRERKGAPGGIGAPRPS